MPRYVKNELSYIPGGCSIEVIYNDGRVKVAENVKDSRKYSRMLVDDYTVKGFRVI